MQEIERRNSWLAGTPNWRERYPTLQQLRQEPFYQTMPQVNLNSNAVQFANSIPTQVGNFIGRNAAANNAWRYPNPQYQNVQLSTVGNQAMIPSEARQIISPYVAAVGVPVIGAGTYLTNQAIQNAFMRSGMGTTPGNVIRTAAYPAAVMATSYMGRLAQPTLNAVNAVANSPLGRWGAKLIDAIF